MPISCEIVSQDRIVYQGDADIVVLPGADGVMGILPNHSPVLTVLKFGIITVRNKGLEENFSVSGGIAEVQPNQVTVLADSAENVVDIDMERAEAARQKAEETLNTGEVQKDTDEYLTIQAALRRSNLRLDAGRRFRKGSRQQ
jgi:F-type H+-transporting ATPase subunit epsilon